MYRIHSSVHHPREEKGESSKELSCKGKAATHQSPVVWNSYSQSATTLNPRGREGREAETASRECSVQAVAGPNNAALNSRTTQQNETIAERGLQRRRCTVTDTRR